MVAPNAAAKPVDFARRFVDMQSLDRVSQFFKDAGKLHAVAPAPVAGRINHAAKFAETIGVPVRTVAPKETALVPRAVAFDKLPAKEAVDRFPELEGAYAVLAHAKKLSDRIPNEANRNKFLAATREKLSSELHKGIEIAAPAQDKGRSR